MKEKTAKAGYEAVITMEDDYFLNCILELESLFEDGWSIHCIERDSDLNIVFVSFEKKTAFPAGLRKTLIKSSRFNQQVLR
jgi:hypothetical protein